MGQITTFDATSIDGFDNLTADNFVVEIISGPSVSTASYERNLNAAASGFTIKKEYEPTTGQFTLSGVSQTIRLRDNEDNYVRRSKAQELVYRVLLIM